MTSGSFVLSEHQNKRVVFRNDWTSVRCRLGWPLLLYEKKKTPWRMNIPACCCWTEEQIGIITKKVKLKEKRLPDSHGLTAGLTALDLFPLSHICFCLVSVASGIHSAVNISRLSAIYCCVISVDFSRNLLTALVLQNAAVKPSFCHIWI